MKFLDNLLNDSILIIPNDLRDKVLEYFDNTSKLKNIKIMTFNDLKKGLFFDYNNETINYIMNKYQVNYDVAKNYIQDLYYVSDSLGNDPKLEFLKYLKNELLEQNMLTIDTLFKQLLKNKSKIYVWGFSYLTKFNNYMLEIVEHLTKVEIIETNKNKYKHPVNEFKTISEEVTYVAESIAKLIDEGVDTSKIYIANYSDDYYFSFNHIFKSYNIPYYIKPETTLYATAIGQYLLSNLEENKEKLLYKIRKKFNEDTNEFNAIVINKLSNFINGFFWCDDLRTVKPLLEQAMKSVRIQKRHMEKEIKETSILNNHFNDDEYVFLIGFNLGFVPKLKKDEDYISDAIKPSYLEKTEEYNKMIKESWLSALSEIKNLTITYKLQSPFTSFLPSFLIDGNMEVIKHTDTLISKYSNKINTLDFARKLDNMKKYNEYDEVLESYASSYDIPYETYDNSYTKVDKNKLHNKINDVLSFSYSNVSQYYECPFKFYLSSILKIREYTQRLDQFIGSLFHYVLEKCLDTDTPIDEVYDEYISNSNNEFTNKEKYFIENLREEIHFIIDIIREQYKYSSHKEVLHEQNYKIPINREISTNIVGFIDKILLCDNNALVVDYKTSNLEINKDLFEFGIGIQLPIYFYLLKKTDPELKIAGLYLQHILVNKKKGVANKDNDALRAKEFMLDGLTFDDIETIKCFDNNYESSSVIQGLKIDKKTNCLKENKHLVSKEEEDELYNLIEKLLIDCIDNVADGDFKINPIKIGNIEDGCKFCEYKDICFRKPKDFNYQEIKVKEKGTDQDGETN